MHMDRGDVLAWDGMSMKNIAVFLSIGFMACVLPAAQSVAKVEPQIRDELPLAFEHFYGIYLNGIKVGWMQSRFSHVKNQASFQVNLEASVAGMGQVSKIRLDETRKYDIQDGRLEELQFVQASSTGAVRILGQREGTQMKMSISSNLPMLFSISIAIN